MKALLLTTRFREGDLEGDACLLVYDAPRLSGIALGDDVRDVLERRPNTLRIYVLAPFLPDTATLAALSEGSALMRAGAVDGVGSVKVAALNLATETGVGSVSSIEYFLDGGKPAAKEPAVLDDELKQGWLFNLFDQGKGLVDAPIGVHFSKASGKHASKFLRTNSVLLTSSACAVVAFFGLAAIRQVEPRRIFVDTAPLLMLGFAMQRIATVRRLWNDMPAAKSFSSYGGVGSLPRLGNSDLVLVSASTSGGLAARLVDMGVATDMLVTIFLLKSSKEMTTKGSVLCDLSYHPGRSFGYPYIENHAQETCALCAKGYILAELEGDQFLIEKRAIKRLRVGQASQSAASRATMETLARTGTISVRLYRRDTRRTDIDIALASGLAPKGYLEKTFSRLLTRFTPTPLRFVVAVGLSVADVKSYCRRAGLGKLPSTKFVTGDQVSQLPSESGANALVLIGHLCDHATIRGINAQLRPKVNGGCVTYLSAVTVADSARNLSDLKIFLTYGELGPDTFTFRSALELMLPWIGEHPSPWEQELKLWQKLTDLNVLPTSLGPRLDWLKKTATASSGLFLPDFKGKPLAIAPDFVLLDTSKDREKISQADVYAVVCNALAAARCDNIGIEAKVQRATPSPTWGQSVYAQCILCPSNFRDFNDAVLRAALIRAASMQELNYSVDEASSEEMRDVILADIHSWSQGRGDALPEFLIAMASGRLRLMPRHLEQVREGAGSADLPPVFRLLAQEAATF